jgi:formylmethanofuran dehydrogenase subunit E
VKLRATLFKLHTPHSQNCQKYFFWLLIHYNLQPESIGEYALAARLSSLLKKSSARHSHLCPRQVLGVRMGLAGLAALGLEAPVKKGDAIVIIETDGCFADGVEVATGTSIGHRNLRLADFGKTAATFVDIKTERAIRLFPAPGVRTLSENYAPEMEGRYFAQLHGYQRMPEKELFNYQDVALKPPLKAILSEPGLRVECERCGEEIINERHVIVDGALICQTCAGRGYYLD